MAKQCWLFSDFVATERDDCESWSLEEKVANDVEKLEAQKLTAKQRRLLTEYRSLRSLKKLARKINRRGDTTRRMMREIAETLGKSDVRELIGVVVVASGISCSDLLEVLKRQHYRCAISGVLLTPECASLDHKVPIAKGGATELENVWWVHQSINSAKGTMSLDEFVLMCRRVVQWTECSAKPLT